MPPDVSLNVVLKTIPVFSCSMSSASAATLETTTLGSCAKVCTGQLLNVYEDSTNLLELAQGFRWPTEYVNGRSRFNSRKLLNKTGEFDRTVRLARLPTGAINELHYDPLPSCSGSSATFTAMRRA